MTIEKLTQSFLVTLIHYDPNTGVFTWLNPQSHWHRPGERADAEISSSRTAKYRIVVIGDRHFYAHRLAWLYVHGSWPKGQIDHIDGVRGNNKISNLRDATGRMNQQNRKGAQKNNKSGLLGASWHAKDRNWRARISIDGKQVRIGVFATAEAAHVAYLKAKRQYHEGCTI